MSELIRRWQRKFFLSDDLVDLFDFDCSLSDINCRDLKIEHGFEVGDLLTSDYNFLLKSKKFYLCGKDTRGWLVVVPEIEALGSFSNIQRKGLNSYAFDPKRYLFRLWTPRDELLRLFKKPGRFFRSLKLSF